MNPIEIFVYATIAANVLFSWQGFNNFNLFERFKFQVGAILQGKEYIRLLSSGFLHVDFVHLFVNMYVFWSFGMGLGYLGGFENLIIVFFGSLLFGNFLALFYNKNKANYSAVGASGAVSGVLYAVILFIPFQKLLLFFVIPVYNWIFGVLYLLYTVYGIGKNNDNIGHEAHLGGALGGVLITLILNPELAMKNWWVTALLVGIPMILFFVKRKDGAGGRGKYTFNIQHDNQPTARTKRTVDDLYYNAEFEREKELNALLEKVEEVGLNNLTQKERNRLEELSSNN